MTEALLNPQIALSTAGTVSAKRFFRFFHRVVIFFAIAYGIQDYFQDGWKADYGGCYCAVLAIVLIWANRRLALGDPRTALRVVFWGTLLSGSIHAIPPVSYVTLGLIPVISSLIFLTYRTDEDLKWYLASSWVVTAAFICLSPLFPEPPLIPYAFALEICTVLVATALILILIRQHDAMLKAKLAEHEELEKRFGQSQKMEAVGHLAAGIAHDFNNLITVISGYSEEAIRRLPAGDPSRELMVPVMEASQRAATLTQQLLAFSRQQVMQPKNLDLHEVASGMVGMLKRILGEDIEFVVIPSSGLDLVYIDPGQLEQIIMNLVINARDAMPQGGKIILGTSNVELDEEYVRSHGEGQTGPHVMIAITDTGAGMDALTLAKIFDPFFTTKEVGKGTGLGLSTVYGIVKQSGGNIWAYSEVGVGTTFKIYLPRSKHAPAPAAKPALSGRSASGHETILVVEDEDALRRLFRIFLTTSGYQVLDARDGEHALEVCRQHEGAIHLLLTDLIMPKMGGHKLAKLALEIKPDMKVAYMSGYTDDVVFHQGILEPGTAFIEKPVSRVELLRKIREFLA